MKRSTRAINKGSRESRYADFSLSLNGFFPRVVSQQEQRRSGEAINRRAWNGSRRRRTCWCETPTSRVIAPHIVPMSRVGVVAAFLRFRWEPRCSENDWLRYLCNPLSFHSLALLSSSTCRSRLRFSSFSTDTCTCSQREKLVLLRSHQVFFFF